MKKKIVVSAINIFEGGPLTILYECLLYLSNNTSKEYEIIAFVYDKSLLSINNITFIEVPQSRKNYIFRLYYEYVWFYFQSKRLKPFLWLSLHDITPNVIADKRVVYCHNPSPFFKISFDQIYKEPKLGFFSIFYSLIYKINLNKNSHIIVQQKWIRDIFKKKFQTKSYILVSPPEVNVQDFSKNLPNDHSLNELVPFFFYPAFPRVFKNFEIICEAAIELKKINSNFNVYLTISGNENRYSKWLFSKYGKVENIKFIGKQDKENVFKLYKKCIGLIFPSKLETWGLPITEAKYFCKPIILADLPYSHETVGSYNKVVFFNPNNSLELFGIMNNILSRKQIYTNTTISQSENFICSNWETTFKNILN